MDMQPVDSSNIRTIGYDLDTQTLRVEFLNDTVYDYTGVPNYEFDQFQNAMSYGKHFNLFIKNNFACTKVS